ncbi:MAG: hypothetical protein K2Y32_09525 [Candidatus Obscuribacterales bacterium]|nr:hypothetical protein [Candidatus Obscuribacterales bacterium]
MSELASDNADKREKDEASQAESGLDSGLETKSETESETESETKSETESETKSETKSEATEASEPLPPDSQKVPLASAEKPVSQPKKNKKKKEDILELGFGTLFLALLSIIAMNVAVLGLAKDYNKRCCKTAAYLAGKAAMDGKDTRNVQYAAWHYLDGCANPGLFIEKPCMTGLEDMITPKLRKITVTMSTKVLVPASFLLSDASVLENDRMHMWFHTTYVFKLKNPKNCQGTHKVNPPAGFSSGSKNENDSVEQGLPEEISK